MDVTNIKKIISRKVEGYAIRVEGVHFIFRLYNISVYKVTVVGAIFHLESISAQLLRALYVGN